MGFLVLVSVHNWRLLDHMIKSHVCCFCVFCRTLNRVLFSWLAKLPRNNGMNQRNSMNLMNRQGTIESGGCHRQQDVRKRFGIHGSFRWLFLSTSLPWNFVSKQTWKEIWAVFAGIESAPKQRNKQVRLQNSNEWMISCVVFCRILKESLSWRKAWTYTNSVGIKIPIHLKRKRNMEIR